MVNTELYRYQVLTIEKFVSSGKDTDFYTIARRLLLRFIIIYAISLYIEIQSVCVENMWNIFGDIHMTLK